MAFVSALPLCTLLLISMFGWLQAEEADSNRHHHQPDVQNNKLRCVFQDPESVAKLLPRDMNITDALEAIKLNHYVEDCKDDQAYCYEMKGCGVFINGTDFALHNAGRRGCLTEDVPESLLSKGLCQPDNNCLECRVCRGDECNQQWFDESASESTAAPGSGSIGTAPVSAVVALLGLLTLGAVVF